MQGCNVYIRTYTFISILYLSDNMLWIASIAMTISWKERHNRQEIRRGRADYLFYRGAQLTQAVQLSLPLATET